MCRRSTGPAFSVCTVSQPERNGVGLLEESSASKELEFYRRRVDELAGQAVRADLVVSRAKRELKQRRQGFAAADRAASRDHHGHAAGDDLRRGRWSGWKAS